MGYRDNPINQPTGLRILRDIYDLIYLKNPGSRKNSDNRLATDNSQMPEIVSNFKQNAPRIVMMMRRFMTGNTHVQTSNAGDSGIFVCNPIPFGMAGRTGGGAQGPDAAKEKGCGRRDFLWWWEFTDFGVYNNYSNWGSSVGLEPWSRNLHDPTYRNKDFQVVVGRVRCNTVNTCDPMSGGCGTTWRGSGNCPSPYCNTKRKVTEDVDEKIMLFSRFHSVTHSEIIGLRVRETEIPQRVKPLSMSMAHQSQEPLRKCHPKW